MHNLLTIAKQYFSKYNLPDTPCIGNVVVPKELRALVCDHTEINASARVQVIENTSENSLTNKLHCILFLRKINDDSLVKMTINNVSE